MQAICIAQIILLLCFQVPAYASNRIYVSSSGTNNVACGTTKLPCGTVTYAIHKRSSINDTILIDGRNGSQQARYFEKIWYPTYISHKLTMQGVNGHPILAFSGLTAAFKVAAKERSKVLDNIKFINVTFAAVGGTKMILSITDASVHINGCRFIGNAIAIEYKWTLSPTLSVINCIFEGVSKGIVAKNGFGLANIKVINCTFAGIKGSSKTAVELSSIPHSYPYPLSYNKIIILGTDFKNFTMGLDFGIDKIFLTELKIDNCQFRNQLTNAISIKAGKSNRNKLYININNTLFFNNTGDTGAALYLFSSLLTNINITNCILAGNRARVMGGAVAALGNMSLRIVNCSFFDNYCNYSNGTNLYYGSGAGGAVGIYSYHAYLLKVYIAQSVFKRNSALSYGGTIYAKSGCKKSTLDIVNSEFVGPNKKALRATVGDVIYSSVITNMSNVHMNVDNPSNGNTIVQFSEKTLRISRNSRISCSVGFTFRMAATLYSKEKGFVPAIKKEEKYQTFSLSCVSCPFSHYSLNESIFKNFNAYNAKCHHCPDGGQCKEGKITAKPNFWGYKEADSINFIRLPDGYGCTEKECGGYMSCRAGRTGVLCARCRRGYSENLLSPQCVENQNCQMELFWILTFLLLAFYVVLFLFKKEIVKFAKRELLWFKKRNVTNHKCRTNFEHQLSVNEDDDDYHDDYVYYAESDAGEAENEAVEARENIENNDPSFFHGLLKVIFYFYQIESVLSMQKSQPKENILQDLKAYAISFFSFKFSGNNTYSCFMQNATPVKKVLLRLILVGGILLILLVLYTFAKVLRKLLKCEQAKKFSDRLLTALFEVFLLCYAAVVHVLFKLLNCIEIDNESVLFIQGDIKCTSWQYALLFVVFAWMVPFCGFIFVLPRQLMQKRVKTWHIFAGCVCPLLYLLSIFLQNLYDFITKKEPEAKDDDNIEENGVISAVKQTMICAFKKDDDTPEYIWWEGVLIFRRLLLTTVVTFIRDPYAKIYSTLFVQLAFLLHHVHAQPYNKRSLNMIETISLSSLTIIGSMNFLDKLDYTQIVSDKGNGMILQKVFAWVQLIIESLIPVLLCVSVLVVCILTIVRVTYKILQCFGLLKKN